MTLGGLIGAPSVVAQAMRGRVSSRRGFRDGAEGRDREARSSLGLREFFAKKAVDEGARVVEAAQTRGNVGVEHEVDAALLGDIRQSGASPLGSREKVPVQFLDFAVNGDEGLRHSVSFLARWPCAG